MMYLRGASKILAFREFRWWDDWGFSVGKE